MLLLPVQLSTVRSERVLPEQGFKSTQTLKPKPKLKRTVNQNTRTGPKVVSKPPPPHRRRRRIAAAAKPPPILLLLLFLLLLLLLLVLLL